MSNFASTITARQHYASNGGTVGPAPAWFRHAAASGKPAAPAFPDTLNAAEQAEVQRYLVIPTDAVLATLRLPDAIAKANAYKTYLNDPAYLSWLDADRLTRDAQWRWSRADALDASAGTTPPSQDDTGGGSAPPAKPIIVSVH